MAIPMNREWARAAGFQVAAESAKKAGRRAWSRADYNRAVREFNRLWPARLDKSGQYPYESRSTTTTILSVGR